MNNMVLANLHSNNLNFSKLIFFPETAQTTWSPSSNISKLFGKYFNLLIFYTFLVYI